MRNRLKGFTLIEIMVAIALFSAVFGSISYMVISAMSARKNAADLTRAVFLARQMMNTIKTRRDTASDQGDFQAFPGYKFKYEIKEIEVDLNKLADLTGGAIDNVEDDRTAFLEERGQTQDTATGAIFKMLQYVVVVTYGNKDEYKLEYYRGMGVL